MSDVFPRPTEFERVPLQAWQCYVQEYLDVKDGMRDRRFRRNMRKWRMFLQDTMPLCMAGPELGIFAEMVKDDEVYDIIFFGITPSSYLDLLNEKGLSLSAETFAAVIRFNKYFRLQPRHFEAAFLVDHALHHDSSALLEEVDGLGSDNVIMSALSARPELLERAGPDTAAMVAGALRSDQGRIVSVFLKCLEKGLAKSLNAILSTGFNPYIEMGTPRSRSSFRGNIGEALRDYDGPLGMLQFPESFRDTLRVIDPEVRSSNHEVMSRGLLFGKGATEKILAQPADARIAGIARDDWLAMIKPDTAA